MQPQSCELICLHSQIKKWQKKLANNKFMIEQTFEGHEFRIYSVKDSQKFKDIQARWLFNLSETSITCRMVENVCNIVVFDSS